MTPTNPWGDALRRIESMPGFVDPVILMTLEDYRQLLLYAGIPVDEVEARIATITKEE